MAEDLKKRFERLKADIDNLKVQRIAAQKEKERMEAEFNELKGKIENEYGVPIEKLQEAIDTMKGKLEKDMADLEGRIAAAKEKLGGL